MLIPAQNSNKTNYKIQDCFANRQIKEDVKCNTYFHCKRGVRQGDPLSSFLFDLVADVLNILVQNAKNLGYLQGLSAIGSFEGILNLHFADDTLLFLEAKAEYIEMLK
jgi:Reverse transcriptase (RNA-dependent DNA polymerase)